LNPGGGDSFQHFALAKCASKIMRNLGRRWLQRGIPIKRYRFRDQQSRVQGPRAHRPGFARACARARESLLASARLRGPLYAHRVNSPLLSRPVSCVREKRPQHPDWSEMSKYASVSPPILPFFCLLPFLFSLSASCLLSLSLQMRPKVFSSVNTR
jgi:hypothetical protein